MRLSFLMHSIKTKSSKQASFKLDDMTFYTGKYIVKGHTVTHFIQNASSSDYYNKKLVRKIELLTDNNLVLSLNQANTNFVLKWQRVG